jgi:alpha-1,2-mannosyltransferase
MARLADEARLARARPPAPAPATGGPRRGRVWRPSARDVVVGLALVAAGLQILRLTRPNQMLSGGSLDTALYLGTAIRFVHGVMPYRDFAFLQPPGLLLVMTPYALASLAVGSRGSLIAITACSPLLAAANVALVGRLVAHRGWRAALAACGLMAVYPATYVALFDGLLEPIMVLFCLVGAVLAFDRDVPARPRRLLAGGVAVGFATSILVVAVLPALVMAVLCARRPRQRLLPFAGGWLAGVAVPALPFLVLSPGPLLHDTIATQLSRVADTVPTPVATRLAEMTFGGGMAGTVAALVVVVGVIAVAILATRRRLAPLEWFAIGSTLTLGVAQFAISIYYPHYPAMLVPFPALLLGAAVGRLTPRWWARAVPALAGLGIAALLITQVAVMERAQTPDWGATVDAVVPAGGCSLSNAAQIAVQSDRFWSPVPGCTALVDPTATLLSDGGFRGAAFADYGAALAHSDYLVLTKSVTRWMTGPYAPLAAYVSDHFQLHRSGPLDIYVRDGFPTA